jgi:hypothetical protein
MLLNNDTLQTARTLFWTEPSIRVILEIQKFAVMKPVSKFLFSSDPVGQRLNINQYLFLLHVSYRVTKNNIPVHTT